MMSVDGGPDERKVINHAIDHFKEHDLDAIYVFTNAPGRSAFNRVERRMDPLRKALSGLVLPHDKFGNHLDGSGKTIDSELEFFFFLSTWERRLRKFGLKWLLTAMK